MSGGPLLFLGVLATTALSFWTLVIAPAFQLGRQDLVEAGAGRYPTGRSGLAQRGADVYRSMGCVECHTQQVRPRGYGSDFARGWGERRTVAQDYLRDRPVLLGNLRIGPDLANIGARQPDPKWHFEHLYDPKRRVPGSTMPAYRFLFERRSAGGGLPEDAWVEGEYEIIPTPEAHALVAYLLSLQSQVSLPEAPLPQSLTNAPPADAGTNAPAGDTNTPAAATNPPAPAK
ncbi:MAG: cbb3-type cytochrome c oxidase subunit II [Verrucomicrobia subdivision 3 bacterium]|nr:cbb3-type cytochrome c oxidase subunit II [Limisphaerales bacterium]